MKQKEKKTEMYFLPEVECVEVDVEMGFAATGGTTEDPGATLPGEEGIQ